MSKILRAHGLEPHLVRTYKVSRDPALHAKVNDLVGSTSSRECDRTERGPEDIDFRL